LSPAGTLTLDDGALAALRSGKSLLPAGITSLNGDFSKGTCVSVTDSRGSEVGRGVVNYSSQDIARIKGLATNRVEEQLGFRGPDEVIHRNDLVLK
jgi:glutamate 5-kinase